MSISDCAKDKLINPENHNNDGWMGQPSVDVRILQTKQYSMCVGWVLCMCMCKWMWVVYIRVKEGVTCMRAYELKQQYNRV